MRFALPSAMSIRLHVRPINAASDGSQDPDEVTAFALQQCVAQVKSSLVSQQLPAGTSPANYHIVHFRGEDNIFILHDEHSLEQCILSPGDCIGLALRRVHGVTLLSNEVVVWSLADCADVRIDGGGAPRGQGQAVDVYASNYRLLCALQTGVVLSLPWAGVVCITRDASGFGMWMRDLRLIRLIARTPRVAATLSANLTAAVHRCARSSYTFAGLRSYVAPRNVFLGTEAEASITMASPSNDTASNATPQTVVGGSSPAELLGGDTPTTTEGGSEEDITALRTQGSSRGGDRLAPVHSDDDDDDDDDDDEYHRDGDDGDDAYSDGDDDHDHSTQTTFRRVTRRHQSFDVRTLMHQPKKVFSMTTLQSVQWRVAKVNSTYAVCPTMPHHVLVPATLDDAILRTLATHCRLYHHFPAVIWTHPEHEAGLLLDGVPLSSAQDSTRSQHADAHASLVRSLRSSGAHSHSPAFIVCPAASSTLVDTCYAEQAEVMVVSVPGVPDAYTLRRQWSAWHTYIAALGSLRSHSERVAMQEAWLPTMHEIGWLHSVAATLEAACQVRDLLVSGSCVTLTAFGAGMGTVVALLTMVLCDPSMRTMQGLQHLVATWQHFGHAVNPPQRPHAQQWLFSTQGSHDAQATVPGPAATQAKHNSWDARHPEVLMQGHEGFIAFMLFCDAMHQLLRQRPHAFEFKQLLLDRLAAEACWGQHGLFAQHSELARTQWGPTAQSKRLVRFWDRCMSSQRPLLFNGSYEAVDYLALDETAASEAQKRVNSLDSISCSLWSMEVWRSFFLQWTGDPSWSGLEPGEPRYGTPGSLSGDPCNRFPSTMGNLASAPSTTVSNIGSAWSTQPSSRSPVSGTKAAATVPGVPALGCASTGALSPKLLLMEKVTSLMQSLHAKEAQVQRLTAALQGSNRSGTDVVALDSQGGQRRASGSDRRDSLRLSVHNSGRRRRSISTGSSGARSPSPVSDSFSSPKAHKRPVSPPPPLVPAGTVASESGDLESLLRSGSPNAPLKQVRASLSTVGMGVHGSVAAALGATGGIGAHDDDPVEAVTSEATNDSAHSTAPTDSTPGVTNVPSPESPGHTEAVEPALPVGVLLQGWVHKQSPFMKTWKRRWLVVRVSGVVDFYQSRSDAKPKTELQPEEVKDVRLLNTGSDGRTNPCLAIVAHRTHNVEPEQVHHAAQWYTTLHAMFGDKKPAPANKAVKVSSSSVPASTGAPAQDANGGNGKQGDEAMTAVSQAVDKVVARTETLEHTLSGVQRLEEESRQAAERAAQARADAEAATKGGGGRWRRKSKKKGSS